MHGVLEERLRSAIMTAGQVVQWATDRHGEDLREEFASALVLRAWRAVSAYDPERGVNWEQWLLANLHYEVKDVVRRSRSPQKRRMVIYLPSVPDPEVTGTDGVPGAATDILELRDWVRRALATLTERQRAAVTLVYLAGYTQEQAAQVLGVSRVTINSTIRQAFSAIRAGSEVPWG